jgi:hypothetical protein
MFARGRPNLARGVPNFKERLYKDKNSRQTIACLTGNIRGTCLSVFISPFIFEDFQHLSSLLPSVFALNTRSKARASNVESSIMVGWYCRAWSSAEPSAALLNRLHRNDWRLLIARNRVARNDRIRSRIAERNRLQNRRRALPVADFARSQIAW